jgi:hypothetical protein
MFNRKSFFCIYSIHEGEANVSRLGIPLDISITAFHITSPHCCQSASWMGVVTKLFCEINVCDIMKEGNIILTTLKKNGPTFPRIVANEVLPLRSSKSIPYPVSRN